MSSAPQEFRDHVDGLIREGEAAASVTLHQEDFKGEGFDLALYLMDWLTPSLRKRIFGNWREE